MSIHFKTGWLPRFRGNFCSHDTPETPPKKLRKGKHNFQKKNETQIKSDLSQKKKGQVESSFVFVFFGGYRAGRPPEHWLNVAQLHLADGCFFGGFCGVLFFLVEGLFPNFSFKAGELFVVSNGKGSELRSYLPGFLAHGTWAVFELNLMEKRYHCSD